MFVVARRLLPAKIRFQTRQDIFAARSYGDRVAKLMKLFSPVPLKEIVLGEALEASGLTNSHAAALLGIVMNEVVTILRNMAGDSR